MIRAAHRWLCASLHLCASRDESGDIPKRVCVERLEIRGLGSPIRRHSCDLAHGASFTCSTFEGLSPGQTAVLLQSGAPVFRYLPRLMLRSAEFSYQALPIAPSRTSNSVVEAEMKAGGSCCE
jgi:hypothetical protein